MPENEKDKILKSLKSQGLINDLDFKNLSISFDEFLNEIIKEKDNLIKEVKRINEKEKNGSELSYIETKLMEYFRNKFAY